MISLKRKPKPVKTLKEMPMEPEAYPYGLKITLDKEELKKMGMELKDYVIGDTMTYKIKCEVVSMRSNEDMHSDSESMELQITHMDHNPHPKKLKY